MSFDELAKKISTSPEAAEHAAARRAERARKPFHDAWLSEVYPHWQGHLVTFHHKAGIDVAVHGVGHRFPVAENSEDILKQIAKREWLIAEQLVVSAVVGVSVLIAYVYAGDENDGSLVRVAGLGDGVTWTLLPKTVRQWEGPLAKLTEAAVADVADAAALFGPLILEAYERKQDRLFEEQKAREAEEKRQAEEAAAREQAMAEEVERQKTAALAESQRLEREAEEKRQAEASEAATPAPESDPEPDPEPEE